MGIGAVDHRIGVAKALAKGLTGGDVPDLLLVDGVVHHHVIGVHRFGAGLLAHTQRIKGMEGVGPQLNARANFANFWRLLKHLDAETLAHQGQCRCQTTDTAAGHQYGQSLLVAHEPILFIEQV